MFQTFDITARPDQGPPRLEALRAALVAQGLDGFIVPRADAHQGEYVAPRDERLSWLTGFTGSAGFCVALAASAGVFIDGRYRTQVKAQVALSHFTPVHWPEVSLAAWLREQLPTGGRIGFDPWLMSQSQVAQAREALEGSAVELVAVADNPVDRIWVNQPGPALAAAKIHPLEFAGESHEAKRARLAEDLRARKVIAAVITLPDSLAWLLNIRGADVGRNPVMQGFGILHDDGAVTLFAHQEKLVGLRDHLGADVTVAHPETLGDQVAALQGPVLMDRDTVPYALWKACAEPVLDRDPCALPKARKNPTEIAGMAEAHLRDAMAMIELLAWLDEQNPGTITETDVVRRLEELRRRDNALQDISFDTISGTGPNGAIMHYRVTEETDSRLEDGHLLVLDSGGQYLDGTTDITRTIAIGDVGEEEKACYTRVLQGMIAMSRLRWPKGLAGRDIEMAGRMPLWLAHQDFDHGLGHGVGAYLNVHEGPQRLSRISHVPLEPGMILSNEPGYYREGAFGIRLENLVVVEEAEPPKTGDAHRAMLAWRTLTFVPLDRRLILPGAMSRAEIDWLNGYHAQVREKVGPRLGKAAQMWLDAASAPI
ncbi:aminopeptidase P family protein [Aestuariivita sp.]|jgi:Xaa-Pro aminopeptidase|uniref:aminopeptidase P family protein n=1 Tax=Aestuariivita sp. TaxID=1872407 RepID=UPI00216C1BF5|nr:aminopeptidase P family protein [Aestuariivita sp.]MCE8008903.1 aminopeptidase P family protein [Aestuariivita sp.]